MFLAGALMVGAGVTGCKNGGEEGDAQTDDGGPADTGDAADTSDAADTPHEEIPIPPNSAVLEWDAPTTNEDGTPLVDLAGYRAYYSNTSGSYSEMVDAGMPYCESTGGVMTCTYVIESLLPGTWYFAVTAYDTSDNESAFSNEVLKTIE
jgi:hypothetical protein